MKVSRRHVVGGERCLMEASIDGLATGTHAITSVARVCVRTDTSRTARVRSGRKSALQEAETLAAPRVAGLLETEADLFCGLIGNGLTLKPFRKRQKNSPEKSTGAFGRLISNTDPLFRAKSAAGRLISPAARIQTRALG